jgi:DNA-binding MarR family transcriptional regulator
MSSASDSLGTNEMSDWGFVTNHALALLCIQRDPDARMREIAECLGVTERAAHRIVSDLCAAGYVTKERVGGRNRYSVSLDRDLRHPLVEQHSARELVDALAA